MGGGLLEIFGNIRVLETSFHFGGNIGRKGKLWNSKKVLGCKGGHSMNGSSGVKEAMKRRHGAQYRRGKIS